MDISEGTVEVLDHQLATNEPFNPEELEFAVPVDTQRDIDYDALKRRVAQVSDGTVSETGRDEID